MSTTIEAIARNYGRSFDSKFNRQMPGYIQNQHGQAPVQKREEIVSYSFTKLILKISGFMVITALALFFLADKYGEYVSKAGHTDDISIQQFVIGNDVISAPLNMVRFRNQRSQTSLSRLDLYAQWPSLSGYSATYENDFHSMSDNAPIIFVSLEPRSMSHEMSGRIEKIYGHFFSGPPIEAFAGLVRRPFSKESAYFSEELFYEVGSPYPYAARCIRESDQVAAAMCIRDIHIGHGLTLTYRFHSSLLPQWQMMEQAIKNKFHGMIAS